MFVAVWPDGPTADRLSELELGPTEEVRLVRPEQWHITLRFLGDVDIDLVPALADTLRSAAAELPDSIHCEVGPGTAWFGGDRVLHIPVSGLDRAADAIRRATRRRRSRHEPRRSGVHRASDRGSVEAAPAHYIGAYGARRGLVRRVVRGQFHRPDRLTSLVGRRPVHDIGASVPAEVINGMYRPSRSETLVSLGAEW